MLKKVNPELFRVKKYNFNNSPQTNFFDCLYQFYTIKRNLFFFIKNFKKLKFFIFYFKLQRNVFKTFKLLFFGYYMRPHRFFYFINSNKRRLTKKIRKKKKKCLF